MIRALVSRRLGMAMVEEEGRARLLEASPSPARPVEEALIALLRADDAAVVQRPSLASLQALLGDNKEQPVVGSPPAAVGAALLDILDRRLDAPASDWLRASVDAVGPPVEGRRFRTAWSLAGGRLGTSPLSTTLAETAHLGAVGLASLAGWHVDECGRAALLIRALEVSEPEAHGPLVHSLYLRATIRERQALLRVLPWLPDPERFLDIAVMGYGSHVVAVFEAIAADNPYPSRYFPRLHFDRLVQKALALRVPRSRIIGFDLD